MALHRRLFFLLLIFLPTQLGFHFWPEWSQLLGRRVDYLSPTIFFTDVLIVAILFTWTFSKFEQKTILVFRKQGMVNDMMMIMLSITCINLSTAINVPVALAKWIKFYEYLLLGWYIVATKVRIQEVAIPLSVAAIYSSLLALAQFFMQGSIGGIFWFIGERTFVSDTPGIARVSLCTWHSANCPVFLRSYATFPHPNVLGGFIAITLPYIFIRMLRLKEWSPPFWGAVSSFLVAIAGLLTSFSRTAWVVSIGTLLGTWLFFQISLRRSILPKKTGHGAIIIFSILLLTIVSINQFPTKSDESFVLRAQLNQASIAMWNTSPFFGIGVGNYLIALPHFFTNRTGNFLQPVHNIYLLLLSEIGIVGVAGIIWLLVRFVKRNQKFRRFTQQYTEDSLLALLSFIGLLAIGVVDHYPLTLQQGQLLFVVFVSLFLRYRL